MPGHKASADVAHYKKQALCFGHCSGRQHKMMIDAIYIMQGLLKMGGKYGIYYNAYVKYTHIRVHGVQGHYNIILRAVIFPFWPFSATQPSNVSCLGTLLMYAGPAL